MATSSSTPSSAPQQLQCQVVLSLAHLLHQQSPRYDSEKNALLSTSAQCALQVARRAQQQQQQQQGNTIEDGSSGGGGGGEVHLFLTGSPRPTFAETNAWLLESYQSPAKNKSPRNNNNKKNDDGRSSSNDGNDNAAADTNDNNICGNKKVGKVNNNADEPLVGHAVVNAISQTSGIGLKCIRSKMLQGTIDRPEWDQTRWTDGECLFSELIGLVGLESFEGGSGGGGAGGTTVVRGKKATNLSANLITVSLSSSSASSTIGTSGMGEDTFEEIARNVLRCLRRRQNSPPASVIYLLLPSDELNDEDHNNGGKSSSSSSSISSSKMASSRLTEAFEKLEKFNDMIGVPRLMADARLEVVHVTTLPSFD